MAFMHYDNLEPSDRHRYGPKKKEGQLLQVYDPLTGALRIHAFREQGEKIARRSPDKTFAVVYFNILDFKNFNERYSFDHGNRLIVALAELIKDYFPRALIGRLFGDQFVVFCDREDVYPAVGYVHDGFNEIRVNMELQLKAGIFILPQDNYDVNTACDRAKTASESIRRQKGIFYRYYDEELNQQLLRKRSIVENIYTAITNEEIEVYYQPVIRTLTGEICGMEALVRWKDQKYGLLSPAEFIPVLEEYQLIHKLDLHVVKKVCEQLRNLKQEGREMVPVSFNLSRLDFLLCDIFDEIETMARFYRVPREMLHVEITESILAGDPQKIKEDIERFHAAGYQVWMDDFGSGYSSFNILKDYNFDLLKIDMLFLRDFSEKAKRIVASMVDMAKKIGIRTLAEGVETREQLDFLREIGCEKGQGYFIGRPQPYEDTVEHLRNNFFPMEAGKYRQYQDVLGNVNLLGGEDFYRGGRQFRRHMSYEAPMPLAIVELRGEKLRVLTRNRAFSSALLMMGRLEEAVALDALNEEGTELYQKCRSFLKVLYTKRESESIDLVVRGHLCSIRGRYLCEAEERKAFYISIYDFSGSNASEKQSRMVETMKTIYEMYEMAVLMIPQRNRCFFVHQAREYQKDNHSYAMTEMREDFGEQYIHPDDLAEYWEFLEPSTMESRMQLSDGVLDAFLRVEQKFTHPGEYRFVQFSIKPMSVGGGVQMLLTLRPMVNKELIRLLEAHKGMTG